MGRGGSGIGWSMSVWPRWPAVEGQDQKYFPHGSLKSSKKRRHKTKTAGPDKRTDAQKLEDGLTKMMGSRAKAQAYIRRNHRKESK